MANFDILLRIEIIHLNVMEFFTQPIDFNMEYYIQLHIEPINCHVKNYSQLHLFTPQYIEKQEIQNFLIFCYSV